MSVRMERARLMVPVLESMPKKVVAESSPMMDSVTTLNGDCNTHG